MTVGDGSISAETVRALTEEGDRVRGFVASNRSDILVRLFDFLLQQSIEGHRPTETEIAETIFHEGSNTPGHQGSRVRVGVYRLRKKLDLFYADKQGPRLTIPPGEYAFLLETPEVTNEVDIAAEDIPSITRRRPGLELAAILMLVLTNAVLAILYFSHAFETGNDFDRSHLWEPFRASKNPAFLVIGDYFMFERKQGEGDLGDVVQDFSIRSADTFYDYVNRTELPRDSVTNDDLYAVSSEVLGPISHVSSYLRKLDLQPTTSSDLNPDMMKSSSIIYLGALDAISPLLSKPLFEASKFRCGTMCYELIDTSSGQRFLADSPYLLGDEIVPRRDYGYIASYPGPAGNQILILSGTGDAGAKQMVNVITDAKMVEQLRQRVGGKLDSFEALYRVRTIYNQSYGSTLLIARSINSERIWDNTIASE